MRQRQPWRYSAFLNHDPNFEEFLKTQLDYFFKVNKTPDVSPGLLWDTMKAYVRGLIISYTARLKKNSIKEQRKLELELHQLQTKYNISPSKELRNDILVVKTALESLGCMNLQTNQIDIWPIFFVIGLRLRIFHISGTHLAYITITE